MQRSVVIGRARRGRAGVWWSRLPAPFLPASSGPVRFWQDRGRVAAKCALAAMAAWAVAHYAVGQQDPYFAPLAALLGVSPTVARSLRQGLQYVAGFVLGAVLSIPVALLLGPSIAGIAVVVLAGVVIGSWRRLGGQSTQVTVTALFVLLIGGYQPLHYLAPRLIDVSIGVAIGLAVNVLVFPPLQLRPAEHAVRQWGDDFAAALDDLAGAAAGQDSAGKSWPGHDRQLSEAAEQARAAARNARESLRWNPRAKVERAVPRPDGAVLDSLEELTARTRAIARVLLDAAGWCPWRRPRPATAGHRRRSPGIASRRCCGPSACAPVRQGAPADSARPRPGTAGSGHQVPGHLDGAAGAGVGDHHLIASRRTCTTCPARWCGTEYWPASNDTSDIASTRRVTPSAAVNGTAGSGCSRDRSSASISAGGRRVIRCARAFT